MSSVSGWARVIVSKMLEFEKAADRSWSFEVPPALRLKRGHMMTSLGARDPLCKVGEGDIRIAFRGPQGPVAVWLRRDEHEPCVHVHAWGDGSDWVGPTLPGLIGLEDQPELFEPPAGPVAKLWREQRGASFLPRLPRVLPSLVQVVLLQLVRSKDGVQSWAKIVSKFGEAAPGPLGLRLAPSAEQLSTLPDYEFAALGVLPKQARTINRVAKEAKRLERAAMNDHAMLEKRLLSIRGIGPWTVGYVRGMALGDPDAMIVGDYGLPKVARFVIEGVQEADDSDFERLLAPYAGHRYRVTRLLWTSRKQPQKRGPRLARAHRPGHGRR